MKFVFHMLILSVVALNASAETLRLPAGATWMIIAPTGKGAADGFQPLLKNTVTRAASLSDSQVNFQIAQDTGFRLLDQNRLSSEGVDITKSWALFDHNGVRYLGVFLKDTKSFDQAVTGWAKRRGLPIRSDRKATTMTSVWSRTTGSRPAMGYARRQDVAVVQLDPAGRNDALDDALDAWGKAVTIKAPVDGALLLWRSSWRGGKDVWTAFRPRSNGVDVFGTARQASDWFKRDDSRSNWVAQATASGAVEVPLRLRTTPAPRMIELIESVAFPVFGVDLPRDLPLTNALGVEVVSRNVDGDALKSSLKAGAIDWAAVLSPRVQVQLKKPVSERNFSTYKVKSDPAGAVVVPIFDDGKEPPNSNSKGSLLCDSGQPVAGARIDVAQASRSLLSIGLLSAMRDDILLGVFGVNAEYGFLMRASEPISLLVCEDSKGRVTFRAHWNFTPKG